MNSDGKDSNETLGETAANDRIEDVASEVCETGSPGERHQFVNQEDDDWDLLEGRDLERAILPHRDASDNNSEEFDILQLVAERAGARPRNPDDKLKDKEPPEHHQPDVPPASAAKESGEEELAKLDSSEQHELVLVLAENDRKIDRKIDHDQELALTETRLQRNSQRHSAVDSQTPGAYAVAPPLGARYANTTLASSGTTSDSATDDEPVSTNGADAPATQPVPTATNSSGLVQATLLDDNNPRRLDLVQADEVDLEQENQRRQLRRQQYAVRRRQIGYVFLAVFAVAMMALVFVLGVFYGKGIGGDNDLSAPLATVALSPTSAPSYHTPSAAPSSPLSMLLETLPNYTLQTLMDPFSPQSEAMHWLENHQNITRLEEWRKVQLFALATLFYSLDGPNWPKPIRNDWLDDTKSECDWFYSNYGVFDEDTGQFQLNEEDSSHREPCKNGGWVYKLIILEGLRLDELESATAMATSKKPRLPLEIGLLTGLKWLFLNDNGIPGKLTEFLPQDVGVMASLKELGLNDNQFTGSIPSEVGLWTSLTGLWMQHSTLISTLPSEIGQLTNMKGLAFGGNLLSGIIPSEIASMNRLNQLWMTGNLLSGLPSEMGLLTALTGLGANDNSLSGSLPSEFALLQNLTGMWIQGNSLSGSVPLEFQSMTALQHLGFNGNNLSGEFPIIPNLKSIRLNGNSIKVLPSEIGLMKDLKLLHLASNQFIGPMPSEIGVMHALQDVDLSNSQFSGSIASELGNLQQLKTLNLASNSFTGPIPSALSVLAANHSLRVFNISGNANLEGSLPNELCSLKEDSCVFGAKGRSCVFEFDCTRELCGCSCNCTLDPSQYHDFFP
ncbi:leucine rich repeat [Seminavis robusta]|uniref:Leucine rich repeat n=1 Tax=Seminavis robusta TaxID=568900 RepID=A0A9N8E5R7_9STRA|nr:leucine rich repeat [Seminavis robusta]|eukprot:Sro649_g181170.1 leucine rich repeat (844) ;mRNA; r:19522-22128